MFKMLRNIFVWYVCIVMLPIEAALWCIYQACRFFNNIICLNTFTMGLTFAVGVAMTLNFGLILYLFAGVMIIPNIEIALARRFK
ncbi:hypothetical protein DA097_00860 [Vibrio rotiferianus]|nr:hypothetical protein DA097_00860 [Vibrio rotiferianus]